jgi:phosphoenolpyruvate synthase/pyruvate phosphate dikinase
VWTSLWNYRAYEEREYYQIPQDLAAMAILVTPAAPDEASNGVAFTGDPIVGASAGYVINVQIGDNSVVHPEVDVLPEKDVLRMESGEVVSIHRARASSLMDPGQWVLSDEQLRRLGAAMAIVDASFPIDLNGYSRDDVLLDIEFKFTQQDELVFKQIRPFLRTGAEPPPEKSPYDLDKDGFLDSDDLFLFHREWMR